MSDTPEFSLPPAQPVSAPEKKRSGKPSFWEDSIVTGFGFATSTAVAYGCWYAETKWQTAIYSWMVNFILPAGAMLCGFVAATGYWIGARLFNHKPSRSLLINIVLVSLTTFFAIHHLRYSSEIVRGVHVDKIMGFGDYLVAVTENMQYKSSRSYSGGVTELGKWGWGVAALQVLGFSLGGFAVYGMLSNVPYCDRCAKYLSEKQTQRRKSKDIGELRLSFDKVMELVNAGKIQEGIRLHAALAPGGTFGIKAISAIELRKCPCCPLRRFQLTVSERNGNQWAVTLKGEIFTEDPLGIGGSS